MKLSVNKNLCDTPLTCDRCKTLSEPDKKKYHTRIEVAGLTFDLCSHCLSMLRSEINAYWQ